MAEFDLQGKFETSLYRPSLAVGGKNKEKAMVVLLDTGYSWNGLTLDEDTAKRFPSTKKLEGMESYKVNIGPLSSLKEPNENLQEVGVYEYKQDGVKEFEIEYEEKDKGYNVISVGFLKDNNYLAILSPKNENHVIIPTDKKANFDDAKKFAEAECHNYSDDIEIFAAKDYQFPQNTYRLNGVD